MMQATFVAALLDPDAAVPTGIVDPLGRPGPKRFSIYRNNVTASLTRALEAAFPTVRTLVGEEFFAAMAVTFLRMHPPTSRMMMLYGDALPDWLKTFPPVAQLGYLPDVARLDQAMRESYHAADSDPLPGERFQRLMGGDIVALRLRLAPSVRLVRSAWPVQSIWAASAEAGPKPQPGAEAALVLRPIFDPRPHRISVADGAFVQALFAGRPLGQCLDQAGAEVDLPGILSLLVAGRAIVGASE
jgi:Putative DNA-binding domain